ncbi:MAG: methylated-DNA--[protein]-cysteine S-methyltransferase [Burkholderiaceae bacterium]
MADADYVAVAALPCAAVGIRVIGDAICEICFLPAGTPTRPAAIPVATRACEQIQAYLDDPARTIDLPLAVEGSEFQRRVWDAICRIPSGTTRTYGELAKELGSTARAVGQACGDNALPLAIPCHRVVAASGIGGFAHRTDNDMLNVKRWLLAHESRPVFALTP